MERIAFVAGSTGVLGQAICHRLAAEGMRVVCGYASKAREAEKLAAALGTQAFATDQNTDFRALTDALVAQYGRVDVLVNAAGLNLESPALSMNMDEWNKVLAVNLSFAFALTQAFARPMLLQRYGRIVHLSSVAARTGGRGQINYAAAKAGLESMVRVFAREISRKGITVNCVAPGIIESSMSQRICSEHGESLLQHIACGRFGLPQDVAHAVAFLAAEQAGYITGTVLPVDGGTDL